MEEKYPARQKSGSLFFPIVLIAVGALWLLSNLGLLPALTWEAILPLWPILLILIGLNLIVQQLPRPLGSLLSALVGLLAVGLVVLVMVAPAAFDWLPQGSRSAELRQAVLDYRPDGIERAEIDLNTSRWPVEIAASGDGSALVTGEITYAGELLEDSDESGGVASYQLNTRDSGGWIFNPVNWAAVDTSEAWQINLNASVPTALALDSGSGRVTADLSRLTLTALDINSGSGSIDIQLPDGSYHMNVDTGSGASSWRLPANANGSYRFNTGSGALSLSLPAGVEARIELDRGSGAFSADDRFTLVEGDDENGAWETPGYDSAEERLLIEIDSGSGSVSIGQATGR